MAEVFDFGLQQHKVKMDGKFFESNLFAVAGDTGRRLEVQLLDSNNMVQNTAGISLRLNANVAGQATYAEATLVDATKGLYELDLPNGMLLAPGNWQFQWQIIGTSGEKLHSFAFTGSVGSNLSEGGSEATNFYLNADELKKMQEDLVNGTFNSSILETNIAEKLTNLETQYAPRLTEVTAQLAETAEQSEAISERTDINYFNQQNIFYNDSGFLNETTKTLTPEAGYYAFTTMVKFNGLFIVFYRKGTGHVSFDGEILYKTSADGEVWTTAKTLLSNTGIDYRDPSAIILNGKLVLKYFTRIAAGEMRTKVISTSDFTTWSNEVTLPSPNNLYNASRGNMAVKNGEVYAMNYTTDTPNTTYLVKSSNLTDWTMVNSEVAKETNEASIVYHNNKFIGVFRQKIVGTSHDYAEPMLFGTSTDGINWSIKEMALYGHCPSIHLLKTGRLLITYRETKTSLTNGLFYFNMVVIDEKGELTSVIYNMAVSINFDMAYGDVFIDGTSLYVTYYLGTKIYKKKFLLSSVQNLSLLPKDNTMKNGQRYLNPNGAISLANVELITGHVNVAGVGTNTAEFTIDLTALNIGSGFGVVVTSLIPSHPTATFETTLISANTNSIKARLTITEGVFSANASILVIWSASIRM